MTKIIKQISIKNLGKFSEFTINLDRNRTYLIGPNGAGKTWTGLYALQIALQGIAEKAMKGNNPLIGERFRVIGPAAASAQVGVTLYDEKAGYEIQINRTVTKSGTNLKIEAPEGVELTQEDLNNLFNAFMINPKSFLELDGIQQARALGIDTSEFDKRIAEKKQEYTSINAVIRSMGVLTEPEFSEPVDFAELSAQKDEIVKFNQQQDERARKIQDVERQIAEIEEARDLKLSRIEEIKKELAELEAATEKLNERIENGNKFKATLTPAEEKKPTDAVDKQIQEANETNKKALAYTEWKKKNEQLEAKKAELKANQDAQAKIDEERLEYIRGFKFPFKNLRVDEDGNLLLEGKPIKEPYFSTGELMKIVPVLIATTKPDLQYVFIKDSNLMDDDRLDEVVEYLNKKGLQLLIEVRGKSALDGKNCILLKDQQIVTSNAEDETAALEI